MSKVKFEVKDGALTFGIDTDEDGENAVTGVLNLSEAVQEAISREESIEGAKIVDFKFALTKLQLTIDTDQDGEPLLGLEIDLGEAFSEVKGAFKKSE